MQESLLKSDVFFFVTTVAVILITLGFVIGLVYLIKILNTLKRISLRAEKTANMVADDIAELRDSIKEKGFSPKRILGFFMGKSRKK